MLVSTPVWHFNSVLYTSISSEMETLQLQVQEANPRKSNNYMKHRKGLDLVTGFFIHKRIRSAVKRVEFSKLNSWSYET